MKPLLAKDDDRARRELRRVPDRHAVQQGSGTFPALLALVPWTVGLAGELALSLSSRNGF
jgi:hypothetical protein